MTSISRMAMKAIGLFGGVQMMSILCSIVRTKLVALWIGPVGVGLFGIFNQALEMINTATNLGIRQSSVRDISRESTTTAIARIIAVVRRWSWWLGLSGVVITMALAPALSQWTFGDGTHIWGFVALSAALLLMALTNGEQAILQGLARLRHLALANLWGTVFGLVVSVPMFYYWREDSVLPSIIAYAAGCFLGTYILRDRKFNTPKLSNSEAFSAGQEFVKLGIFMTLGSFVAMLADYVFRAWLNTTVSTLEVGFYIAGYTLVNRYTGLVLNALGMEYYPRLARVADSPKRLTTFVSKEITIAMMVMAPVVAIFLLLRGEIVWLLYSSEFRVIIAMVSWGLLGTVWRSFSWCLSFVILAKGHGRIYIVTETLSDAIGLALNIAFYMLWGLEGLGIAFLLWYVIYTAMMLVIYCGIYRLQLSWGSIGATFYTILATAAVMIALHYQSVSIAIALTAAIIIIALVQARLQWRR